MKTKEDKEYKEAMEYIMAKEKAEKEVLDEIESIKDSWLYGVNASDLTQKIKYWQSKLK